MARSARPRYDCAAAKPGREVREGSNPPDELVIGRRLPAVRRLLMLCLIGYEIGMASTAPVGRRSQGDQGRSRKDALVNRGGQVRSRARQRLPPWSGRVGVMATWLGSDVGHVDYVPHPYRMTRVFRW